MTYKKNVDKYLNPYFGESTIRLVTSENVDNFFEKYSYLSESVLKKFLLILNNIFELAIKYDHCYKNPTKGAEIAGKKSKERRTYAENQRDILYAYAIERGEIDIAILLETGIRRSELLGLCWGDIDIENCAIRITCAVTPDVGTAVKGDTKSAHSYRAIPISVEFAEYLANCTECSKNYIVHGKKGFMSPSGYAKSFRMRLAQICAELNIPALTPHELRHTFGTLHHKNGVDIFTISRTMGHSTIDVTSKYYIHDDLESLRNGLKLKKVDDNLTTKTHSKDTAKTRK